MKRKNFSPGPLFGESVEKNSKKGSLPKKDTLERANEWVNKGFLESDSKSYDTGLSRWRLMTIYVVIILVFVTLFSRAFELQIIEGDSFVGKAEDNRYRVKVSHAPRGVIYDRNGVILARNAPSFAVVLDPFAIPNDQRDEIVKSISRLLKVSESSVNKKLASSDNNLPITIKNGVKHEIVLKLETNPIVGVEVEVKPKREYPYGEITAHLIGYTSEVSEEEMNNPRSTPHQLGDRVGRDGVEASLEDILRGANGYDLLKVDASGVSQGSLVTTEPVSGNDITLSIDIELQKKAYESLKKWLRNSGSKAGSVVVMDPNNGEVLALVSYPSYNNNVFENGLTQKKYDELISSKNKPLLNRAIGSAYPPASTFKLITAAAGLESGNINPSTTIVDTGFVKLGDQVFNNWYWLDSRKTDGAINVVRAIARSNDTFFYKLGQRIGEVKIQDMARQFLLGSETGVNLPSETAGLVPTEQWKIDTKGEIWYPGETLNLSIGQGDLLVSPLQLSLVSATFANGGNIVKPNILKIDEPEILKGKFLSDTTIKAVQSGMYENTRGDGNVSYLFNSFKPKTAGKTGTAESGRDRPHAWYTGYAPYENPEIVVTVMAEYAGHGSEVSAPATKEIFGWWFKNR